VIRAAGLALLAAAAAGCGSDLGPTSTPPASPVRILLAQGTPQLAQGVKDAVSLVGGRTVTSPTQADLVVTATTAAARAALRRNGGTHVLLVGPPPTAGLPAGVRQVVFDRGELAYLAGAAAALRARSIAVAEPRDELAAAFRAGAQAAAPGASVTSVGCGAPTPAAVVYVPDPRCRPAAAEADVIAPARLPGASMLAVLGPRVPVVVAAAARSVQDGTFQPGIMLEGLREDAIGFDWVSPALQQTAVDRLQHVEDSVRAETANVPSVAP
jgi:hypothetical protein